MTTDADRIAQLTAELAEARHQLFKADSRHDHDVKIVALRALAARVPLLEAVANRARDLAAETESNAFQPLRDALAALDDKGGGS